MNYHALGQTQVVLPCLSWLAGHTNSLIAGRLPAISAMMCRDDLIRALSVRKRVSVAISRRHTGMV